MDKKNCLTIRNILTQISCNTSKRKRKLGIVHYLSVIRCMCVCVCVCAGALKSGGGGGHIICMQLVGGNHKLRHPGERVGEPC